MRRHGSREAGEGFTGPAPRTATAPIDSKRYQPRPARPGHQPGPPQSLPIHTTRMPFKLLAATGTCARRPHPLYPRLLHTRMPPLAVPQLTLPGSTPAPGSSTARWRSRPGRPGDSRNAPPWPRRWAAAGLQPGGPGSSGLRLAYCCRFQVDHYLQRFDHLGPPRPRPPRSRLLPRALAADAVGPAPLIVPRRCKLGVDGCGD